MKFDEALKLRDAYRQQYLHMCKVGFSDGGYVPKSVHAYDPPNGGKRILPSLYCKLRDFWWRSTGKHVAVKEMNDGHIENTLKLLQESHGNVQARAQDLLGRMSYHYQNSPDICAKLSEVCLLMQQVDVDDMYPIFTALSAEWHRRHTDEELDIRDILFNELVDDNLEKW